MKKIYYWIIGTLLVIAIAAQAIQIFYHPSFILNTTITEYFVYHGLSHLFFISLIFILCGWLAWLIYKINLSDIRSKKQEIEESEDKKRKDTLEVEAKKRQAYERQRSRINDFIRLVELAKDKPETKTEEPAHSKKSEEKDKPDSKITTTKCEGLSIDNLNKLLEDYQNIIKLNPENE
jgi:hypothetical protein